MTFLRIHIQFCQSWVSFLRPIQMALEKITMSYATCTILQCDYGAFLLHYMPARNLHKKKDPWSNPKWVRVFGNFNDGIDQRVPLSAAMANGFDFAHRYFKTRKGREIVTKARSLIEFNRNRNTIIEGREKMCNQWFSFLIVFLCMAIAKTIFQIPRHQITITWCVGFWAHNRMRI